MASWESSETSFSLSGVRERMREKKRGPLKTAKLNASLASKIKTKIINNSSTIKVSLKHNNKALALALNAEKANAQRLTQEKTVLQKEVEQCHFQNAVLRHKLSFLNNTLKELENLIAAVKMAQLSEFHTSSASLSSDQKSSVTEDSWADDIAYGQLVRAAGMPMRVRISKLCDAGQQGGSSTAVQTSSQDLQHPASNEPLEIVPVASKDMWPPQPAEKPQSHQEENGTEPTKAVEVEDSHIFGEALCTTQQNPNNMPALAQQSSPLSYGDDEMAKQFFDPLSQGHVTQRRKHSTLFATSTPSSGVDLFPCVSSNQVACWSTTKDSSSSRKSNTQPQLKSPCSLLSPTQATVTPDRNLLVKKIFCDQPQAKETECGIETGHSYSQVSEFKVKSKGNCKTAEKTTVKRASTGKKKTNTIRNNTESSPDILQDEEIAQNAKKVPQPKVVTCSRKSEVSEMKQKACVGDFNKKNRGFGVEQHSHSPDEVQDRRRTHVNAAQVHSPGSSDLVQQVRKEAFFEIQSMESLSKSPVCTFSSHEVPSDYSSLQNSLFSRKETSSACALQEDSDVSVKSIRQKTNRKTRVIRKKGIFEENLSNSVKIPEAKAEEQSKRSRTSLKKTVRKSKSNCNDQRKEVDIFGPCIDVQEVAKESTKDSLGNLKCNRKTYVICPLDLSENLYCVQTAFEGDGIVPPTSVPGSKASKIPRLQRMVAAQSHEEQTGGLQEKGEAEVDNNINASKKEPKPKPLRNTSRPPKTDSFPRQSDGKEALIGSLAELESKQTVLRGMSSCITEPLTEPDAFSKEQEAAMLRTNNLRNLSHSPESFSVTLSAASPLSSRLTGELVSKSLSTGSSRMAVWPKSSLILQDNTAEKIPGERKQVESSSQSSPSQKSEIGPLQDLTNARTSSTFCSEVLERSSRRRREPPSYAEPKINSKLRQGDPFTDTAFLHYTRNNNTAKARGRTKMTIKKKNAFQKDVPVPEQAS